MVSWRRGLVVIVPINATEDCGFESCRGVKVLGLHIRCSLKLDPHCFACTCYKEVTNFFVTSFCNFFFEPHYYERT
jgi:hypothetical protein